jgi:succinylglutamate desuccinylase
MHGREQCGVDTVLKLFEKFLRGEHHLQSGSLILAIGNEDAVMTDQRQVTHNLNRLIGRPSPDNSPESLRAQEITTHAFPTAAIVLDLHSTSLPSTPFSIVRSDPQSQPGSFTTPRVVTFEEQQLKDHLSGTTLHCATAKGLRAVTVECGQHDDPQTTDFAKAAALSTLVHHRLIQPLDSAPNLGKESARETYSVFEVAIKKDEKFRFRKDFESFEQLDEGAVIGTHNGNQVLTDRACSILFPTKPDAEKVGAELYFLATRN